MKRKREIEGDLRINIPIIVKAAREGKGKFSPATIKQLQQNFGASLGDDETLTLISCETKLYTKTKLSLYNRP